jgi:hypothetical protein
MSRAVHSVSSWLSPGVDHLLEVAIWRGVDALSRLDRDGIPESIYDDDGFGHGTLVRVAASANWI